MTLYHRQNRTIYCGTFDKSDLSCDSWVLTCVNYLLASETCDVALWQQGTPANEESPVTIKNLLRWQDDAPDQVIDQWFLVIKNLFPNLKLFNIRRDCSVLTWWEPRPDFCLDRYTATEVFWSKFSILTVDQVFFMGQRGFSELCNPALTAVLCPASLR